MIVDAAGYVLTNEHVVTNNQTATIVLANGREWTAAVLARDEITDLAILKVSADKLTAVTIGKSADLKVGDEVIAVGFPMDLGGSATASKGIVSAFRTYDGVDYLQTDAAINPGNSGGPLINLRGEVVGINSYKYKGAEGMNLAIAIDSAKPVVPRLMAGQSIFIPTPTPEPWKAYTNLTYGYSIEYPSTWSVGQATDQGGSKGDDSEIHITERPGPGALVIIRAKYTTKQTLDEYVEAMWFYHNWTILLDRRTTRLGFPAREFVTVAGRDNPTAPLQKNYMLFVKSGNIVYDVSGFCSVQSEAEPSPMLDRILASFRLL